MYSITTIIKNIRNLLPYFALIGIYFFFINIEARRGMNYTRNSESENIEPDIKNKIDNTRSKITIPVIPYKQ